MTLNGRRFTTATTLLAGATLAAYLLSGSARTARLRADTADEAYRRAVDDWHQKRIERLTSSDGYLALVGLFPLEPGANRFGSGDENQLVFPEKAPKRAGTIYLRGGQLEIVAMPGVEIRHGADLVDRMPIVTDAEGNPSEFAMGSFRFYVIERAGERYLRVKDRDSELRRTFSGIERFPVDSKWRVEARFEPYDPPKLLNVPNVLGFEADAECPGVIVFELGGKTHRLEPMSSTGDEFFVVFGDETNGLETYGGGRFLYTALPDEDGKMVLDFNRSYNPPCAFTPYATCPLPHRANLLSVRIEAGEKAWGAGNH